MSDLQQDEEAVFEASKLGSKSYWDDAYSVELQNFHDHGEEGEIWFGKQCEKRIIEWISQNFDPSVTTVLDIGSGNGHLLLSLAKKRFIQLNGIDYSPNAVKLGEALFAEQSSLSCVFAEVDFLNPSGSPWFATSPKFDLLIDKGTFDAISLGSSVDPNQDQTQDIPRTKVIEGLASKFKQSLVLLFNPDSRFVITSCNWTKDELVQLFGPEFEVDHQIDHPSFKFAGSIGQVVTTLVFRRSVSS